MFVYVFVTFISVVVVEIALSIIMTDFMPSLLVTAKTDTTAMDVTSLIVR
jgi:hypothetical protein